MNKMSLILKISLFMISFIPSVTRAQEFYLFVGTYTSSGSKGIYVYDFNAADGKMNLRSSAETVNPSFLSLSSGGNYLYAVNETHGSTSGGVSAFSFDKKEGQLHFLNHQLSGGDDPCHVSVSKDNQWVAVANYSGGSVAVFPINAEGSLLPFAQLIPTFGSSIDKGRQEKSHIHEAIFSPDFKYLLTPDLGADKIMIYQFDPNSEKPLKPASQEFIKVPAGSGPRHIVFHPNEKFMYVINELDGSVIAYSYHDGNFTSIQTISTHDVNFKGAIGGAEIHVSPDGRFLYVSNRGDQNSMSIFSVEENNGRLKFEMEQSVSGKSPRDFMIDPTGNFLLVANQNSDNIVIFKRDKITGLLQEIDAIRLPKPVCLKMISK